MWADSWTGQRPRWYRMWKRLSYWMPLSLQSLLVRPNVWSKESLLLMKEDQDRIHLIKLDILYQTVHGPCWDAPMSAAKGTPLCHYKDTLDNLWMFLTTGRDVWELKKNKCHLCLQKEQEGGLGELRVGQPLLGLWEDDETANPGNHF